MWVSANHGSRVGELLRGMDAISVDIVASGLECYQAMRDASYCAIVAEFPLPDCSPDELLEEVQRVESSLPVLIHDPTGGFSDVVRLTKAGAQHFFGADFDSGEFIRQIEAAWDCEVHLARSRPGENFWWEIAARWITCSASSIWSGGGAAPSC